MALVAAMPADCFLGTTSFEEANMAVDLRSGSVESCWGAEVNDDDEWGRLSVDEAGVDDDEDAVED